MKTNKLILALTIAITMGVGATAYAADTTDSINPSANATTTASVNTADTNTKVQLKKITNMKGKDFVQSVLKNTLGVTDQEISDALNSNKKLYDLAIEKGMTEDEFKAAILQEKNTAIDKAVADGKITSEEGASIKETLKNNVNNCTKTPGEKMNKSENKKGHKNNSMSKNKMNNGNNCSAL